jgi:hypothetical protein
VYYVVSVVRGPRLLRQEWAYVLRWDPSGTGSRHTLAFLNHISVVSRIIDLF